MKIFFSSEIPMGKEDVKEDFIQQRFVHVIQSLNKDRSNKDHLLLCRLFQICLTNDIYVTPSPIIGKKKHASLKNLIEEFRNKIDLIYEMELNISYERWKEQRVSLETLTSNFLDNAKDIIGDIHGTRFKQVIKEYTKNECLELREIFNNLYLDKKSWTDDDYLSLLLAKRKFTSSNKSTESEIYNSNQVVESIIELIKIGDYFKKPFIDKSIEKYIEERSILFYSFIPKESGEVYFFEKNGVIFEKKETIESEDFKKISKSFEEKGDYEKLYFLKSWFKEINIFSNVAYKLSKVMDSNSIDVLKNAKSISRDIYLMQEMEKTKSIKVVKEKKKI